VTVAILRCNGCGHQFFADAIWIRRKLSLYFDGDNASLVGRLQAAAPKFVCSRCGARAVEVSVPRTRAAPKQSREPKVSSQVSAADAKRIDAVLRRGSWLYSGELSFLQSLRGQVRGGGALTDKQRMRVYEIGQRVSKRQELRFFQGGSPGLGRRK
jgi:hypothetical protein